jgi:DNA-binding MarR family transcriptional regulator
MLMSTNKTDLSSGLLFLTLLKKARSSPGVAELEMSEEHLLNLLGTVWQAGKQITVLQAMAVTTEVSITTIHRRLKSLRKKGFIILINDLIDTRIKYVMPTDLALRHFTQIGLCMKVAMER